MQVTSKLAKVMTLPTFEICSLWGSFLPEGCFFQGVVTFGGQNMLYKIDMTELTFCKIKDGKS